MLQLVAVIPAHPELLLLRADGHAVAAALEAHRHVLGLGRDVTPYARETDDLVAAIERAILLVLGLDVSGEAVEGGIEDVEREDPLRGQMPTHAAEARELVLDRVEVLEWPEG